jgi:hypothetical protein
VQFKRFGDHITFKPCTVQVRNILFGEVFAESVGEMIFRNHVTNDYGVLNLKGKAFNKDVYP